MKVPPQARSRAEEDLRCRSAVCGGVAKAGKDVTKKSLIDAFEAMKSVDIGLGTQLSLDKQRHQASDTVWPTIIRGNEFRILAWRSLKK